jgi:hypothetical protein
MIRSNVSIFESQNRTLGVGDTIQLTTPWKEKGITLPDTAVIDQSAQASNFLPV